MILGIIACNQKQKNENGKAFNDVSEIEGFDYLDDFERSKSTFSMDSIPMDDYSSDGGELILYLANEKDYQVFDFWLFGETGKLNYTYWTDKSLNFNFIKQMKFEYDKPYYEEGFKTDTLIRYLSYENTHTILFDVEKKEVNNTELIESTKNEMESFFRDLTQELDIPK